MHDETRRISDLEQVAAEHEARAKTLRTMAANLRAGRDIAHGLG